VTFGAAPREEWRCWENGGREAELQGLLD